MTHIVVENAKGLIPNKDHKNFTETRTIYPEGCKLEGDYVEIKGMRKGEPFTYRLFKVKDLNEYLYSNKIKPTTTNNKKMETTEVFLGPDAQVTPTKVSVPSNENSKMANVVGAVVGAGAGFAFAKYRKIEGNARYVYMAVGALAGFFVTRMLINKDKIKVKTSK
jgi:hypothetical protein